MRRTAILTLGAIACTLLITQSASAQVQPAGTGEPAYTNSTQNTQFLEWPGITGVDAYRVRVDYYENNVLKPTNPTVAASKDGGSMWANWSGVATLQHGGQYGICAQGQYRFPNDMLWISDGPNSCSMGTLLGRRGYTTIDRSKPNAGVQLAAGAAYVKDAKVPVRVDFADDVAGPVPRELPLLQGRRRLVRHERRRHLWLQRLVLRPRKRRQVDHVLLHGRLRRHP